MDKADTLLKNMASAGLIGMTGDPRDDPNVAKRGHLKLLKTSMEGVEWQKLYFVLVKSEIYYFQSQKEPKGGDDDDDDDDDDDAGGGGGDMAWKGHVNVAIATVRAALGTDRWAPR